MKGNRRPKKRKTLGTREDARRKRKKDIMEEWEMEGEGEKTEKEGEGGGGGIGKGEGGKISIRFSIGADQ